ncbi:hypothetical protein UlMin_015256 [Ulmus minor]
MATSLVQSSKNRIRLESRKSHSWWWDSHVSSKNSKWLSENLEEMDKSVKKMLRLIEEDGDSFAKKAEMYYQKRPELISHVEEFYRMYRSLAERYDHVTGELRKNIPTDLQSQSSTISDNGSDLTPTWPSSDQRTGRRKSGNRAAGFDFFLGSGGGTYDNFQKEGDESSTLTDSEAESDDSSVNNYALLLGNGGGEQGLQRKIIELEIELRDVKEKLRLQREDNLDGSSRGTKHDDLEEPFARITRYEDELRIANERIHNSDEEIARLKTELRKHESTKSNSAFQDGIESSEMELEVNQESEFQESVDASDEGVNQDSKMKALVAELRITKGKLRVSENEITSLRYELERNKSSESNLKNQIESAKKDVATWKAKHNTEKREVSKFQERITRLKNSLSDRDREIWDLKMAVSDAEQKIFPEKAQVKAEISKLLKERVHLEEQVKEVESRERLLEEEIRNIKAEKTEMEERLNGEIEPLKAEVVERGNCIVTLNKSLESLTNERDDLNAKLLKLTEEAASRDCHIDQLNKQLQGLHNEHEELIAESKGQHKLVEELKSRTRDLEAEIERQKVAILNGAEEKREAIRQLCFSIEHYRSGYQMLRQAFVGHKRVPVLAS